MDEVEEQPERSRIWRWNTPQRRKNAEPWEPLAGMVKRRCETCLFYFATPQRKQLAVCPGCDETRRRVGKLYTSENP